MTLFYSLTSKNIVQKKIEKSESMAEKENIFRV